ncbi:hypothetical protein FLONG3_8633 [Fusarium longipes]|uniref:Uncharacterized protein n=1 Tax=Fusarium longipes TaxID=694270 RepID=A0A395S3Y2_9HYPO|nr:hypothetical protein FLONG3_8633 [Fusarium longipes]
MPSYSFIAPSHSVTSPYIANGEPFYPAPTSYTHYIPGLHPVNHNMPAQVSDVFQGDTVDYLIDGRMQELTPKQREIAQEILNTRKDIPKEQFAKFLVVPAKDAETNQERNRYVNMLADFGIKYKSIIILGDLDIAESTLRGIRRTSMKPAEDRPRTTDHLWNDHLIWTMRLCISVHMAKLGLDETTEEGRRRIPWGKVADLLHKVGGPDSFKFSPKACKNGYIAWEARVLGEDHKKGNRDKGEQ